MQAFIMTRTIGSRYSTVKSHKEAQKTKKEVTERGGFTVYLSCVFCASLWPKTFASSQLRRYSLPMSNTWPSLPLNEWKDTCATLHMWSQIVGKVRLEQTPLINHWWNVPLYVSARGLTTTAMPYGDT